MKAFVAVLALSCFITLDHRWFSIGQGVEEFNFHEVVKFSGFMFESSDQTEINGISRVNCGRRCSNSHNCVSFSYDKKQRRCLLHDIMFYRDNLGQTIESGKYYVMERANCSVDEGFIYPRNVQSCYWPSTIRKRWDMAKRYCDNNGMKLAKVDTAEKFNFLHQSFVHSGDSAGNFFIGLSDQKTELQFLWLDGEPVTWAWWIDGQPKRERDNDCVVMKGMGRREHRFTTQTCNRHLFKYLCEKNPA